MRRLLAALLVLLFLSVPASAQSVGALVAADPVADAPPGMQAWKIRYWTSTPDGARQEVTGMVVAPRETAPSQPRRVIAWTHGTSGVVEKCAPSLLPGFFAATPALEEMIRSGYVIVAPDYPGLGSPMPHPYLIGQDTARSVLDAVRAARAIPGAAAGPRFAVWGESQGGHAALWTAIEAKRYAPDLVLVGAAAAAPPTDLAENMRRAEEPNARALLMGFTMYSWSRRFGYSMDGILSKRNQDVATRLSENACLSLENKPSVLTVLGILSLRGALKKKDLGTIRPWSDAMRQNSVDPAAVPGPLLISQGTKDTLVAPAVTRKFAKAVCKRGTAVRWVEIPGGGHIDAARKVPGETLEWIGARFDGQAPPDDCGRI